MSDDWTWHYNPDAEHVIAELPSEVVAEVERLADQLTILGYDAAGRGPAHGGAGQTTLHGLIGTTTASTIRLR